LARGDAEVEALVRCLRVGVCERDEIVAATNLTRRQYHNARRRLRRLTAQLPTALRDLAGDS
jgi:hypothetical protein